MAMKLSQMLLLVLAFITPASVRAHSKGLEQSQLQTKADICNHASASSMICVDSESPALIRHSRVTRFVTRLDGDHSLDTAIVAEQVFGQHTLYTVRLQFTSGAEQSLAITAPPGGLQPAMRDMSGDNIPNDLVLSSGLLRLPLVVLLNEGHDHLTVANSPGSLGSDEGQALGSREAQRALATVPSGLKIGRLTTGGKLLRPPSQEILLSSRTWISAEWADYPTISGRAPPAHLKLI
jgi:hypothetical protein